MQLFVAMVWSFGANAHESTRPQVNEFLRGLMQDIVPDLPDDGDVGDYVMDADSLTWMSWLKRVPDFNYDPAEPYFNILVPTADTAKYSYFLDVLALNDRNVLMMGEAGVGKSVTVQSFMRGHSEGENTEFISINVMFSAQTSSINLQDVIESKVRFGRASLLSERANE